MKHKLLCIPIVLTLCMSLFACSPAGTQQTQAPESGALDDGSYYSAAFDGDAFWAAGSGGRLARITKEKELQIVDVPTGSDLRDILVHDDTMLVCGSDGTILLRDQDRFLPVETNYTGEVSALARFGDAYYAGGQSGTLLSSTDGMQWERIDLPTENDIIGIAANDRYLMAITEETDYFISSNGQDWKSHNFNDYYKNYYPPYEFHVLYNVGSVFFVVGVVADSPQEPVILFTEEGDVFSFKPLGEINGQQAEEFFPLGINALGSNTDQIVAACDNGRLLTITDCFVCHEMGEYSDVDLRALVFSDDQLLIVGENFAFDLVDVTSVRQYDIKAEQAYADQQSGAVIIDVRTAEERREGFIPNSIHIPVDEVADRLLLEVPDTDTQLIFYCAAGGRSQAALETARELGYSRVYNLGGLNDWIYEIAWD